MYRYIFVICIWIYRDMYISVCTYTLHLYIIDILPYLTDSTNLYLSICRFFTYTAKIFVYLSRKGDRRLLRHTDDWAIKISEACRPALAKIALGQPNLRKAGLRPAKISWG